MCFVKWLELQRKRPILLHADPCFFYYESQFVAKFQHSLISLFNNNCRYLDDILTVNNHNVLTFVKQTYPKELSLNRANNTSESCEYLDLDIYLS